MLSITMAAKQFDMPRDTVLDAVRDGRLKAVRDRRGVLRIDLSAMLSFCGSKGKASEAPRCGNVVPLGAMRADRLSYVVAQQSRLLREVACEHLPSRVLEAV
jgi:excisionase family DNA binding protein